jgi:hypothetical protein
LIELAVCRGVSLERSIIVGRSAADRTMAERLGMRFRETAEFFGTA